MNVNFEKIDNVNAKITISITEDDYRSELKKNLTDVGIKHPIKGFRPGKAPMSLLHKIYGQQVLSDILDRKVGRAFSEYVTENKVNLLGEPLPSNDEPIDLKNQKDFNFTFALGLAPEFEVKLDKKVKIPYYNIEVSDEMLENQIASFRKRFGKQVPGEVAAEDSLIRGSLVELNEDGTEKEGGINAERTMLVPAYFKNDDQKQKFVGAKPNTDIVYNPSIAVDGNVNELASLLNLDKDQADVKSDFRFHITEVLVNEDAELDQELFDNALGKDQAKDIDEFKVKVREMLAAQLTNDSNYRFSLDAENVLKKKVGDLELPEDFLKRFLASREENPDPAKIEENFPNTKEQLTWHLIKEKIAQNFALKLEVEDKMRLARYFAAQQFAQYGMSNLPDDVIDNYAHKLLEDERYAGEISSRAMDDKIFAQIKSAVTLDEKSVTVEEFNKLFEK
ncbi:MAG: trigger factor [Muribaculaceae bacterium]|nr:trigger factor [Muribaculaceae bacterium]